MVTVAEYATIGGTCGKEKTIIVTFKYSRRDEVLTKILEKYKTEKLSLGVIFELVFRGYSFRLFSAVKAIFSDVPGKEELQTILAELLQ